MSLLAMIPHWVRVAVVAVMIYCAIWYVVSVLMREAERATEANGAYIAPIWGIGAFWPVLLPTLLIGCAWVWGYGSIEEYFQNRARRRADTLAAAQDRLALVRAESDD